MIDKLVQTFESCLQTVVLETADDDVLATRPLNEPPLHNQLPVDAAYCVYGDAKLARDSANTWHYVPDLQLPGGDTGDNLFPQLLMNWPITVRIDWVEFHARPPWVSKSTLGHRKNQ